MTEATEGVTRGVVEVAGPEARSLLQRLVTNDVDGLAPGKARYAALLTPQGKIVVDFIVVSAPLPDQPERFLLDCPAPLAASLTRKLTAYRLRAKVGISDLSATIGAGPLLRDGVAAESGLLIYADPRHPALGMRAIGAHEALAPYLDRHDAFEERRIAANVPEGGADFAYDDAFPHEANLDRLAGVDFTKGCYVGQEVVSRMQHRATVRKRVVPIRFDGDAPPVGTPIRAGERTVGIMGSSIGREGLALVRLDHATDATVPITAGDQPAKLRLE